MKKLLTLALLFGCSFTIRAQFDPAVPYNWYDAMSARLDSLEKGGMFTPQRPEKYDGGYNLDSLNFRRYLVDDTNDAFYFKLAASFKLRDHEYTLNGGTTVADVTTFPIPVGNVNKAAGQVGVRVRAALHRNASAWLFSDFPYTTSGAGSGPVVEDVRFVQPTPSGIITSSSGAGNVTNNGTGAGNLTSTKKLSANDGSYFQFTMPSSGRFCVVAAMPQTANVALCRNNTGDGTVNLYSGSDAIGLGNLDGATIQFIRQDANLRVRKSTDSGASFPTTLYPGTSLLTPGGEAKFVVSFDQASLVTIQPITGYDLVP